MRSSILLCGIAGAAGLIMLGAPGTASAACSGATTGTVVGGVGGAVIGNAIGHDAAGTILGGLGGAVVGHEIGKSGCAHHRAYGYRYERHGRHAHGYAYGSATASADASAAPVVYYDPTGRPVYPDGAYAQAASTSEGQYAPWGTAPCRTEDQSYYDERGVLMQRAVQVCDH
jgi:hypothetical protein